MRKMNANFISNKLAIDSEFLQFTNANAENENLSSSRSFSRFRRLNARLMLQYLLLDSILIKSIG